MKLLTLILLVLFSTSALAHPPLYKLPKGTRITTPNGIVQSYTLEEMKVLLKIDEDLETAEVKLIPEYKILVKSYETKAITQDSIIKSKDVQIDLLKKDRERISQEWSKENLARHQCENKPQFGNWISWGIAGLTSAVALSLGIVLAIEKN